MIEKKKGIENCIVIYYHCMMEHIKKYEKLKIL